MGTRSIIAKEVGTNFEGVYCHWDGYPAGLGATLYRLATGPFKGKLDKMLEVLIYNHISGWSSIVGWDGKPENVIGFDESERRQKEAREVAPHDYTAVRDCIEHCAVFYDGSRADPDAKLMTMRSLLNTWCEYLYTFDVEAETLEVCRIQSNSRILLAIVRLNPEPNWAAIESSDTFLSLPFSSVP